ncbi:MAG: conjugal transfer protein TraR [Ignavibacteria bacterium]|nr:conjugal transfer protein TraR [Ignavibacteria bacterium]
MAKSNIKKTGKSPAKKTVKNAAPVKKSAAKKPVKKSAVVNKAVTKPAAKKAIAKKPVANKAVAKKVVVKAVAKKPVVAEKYVNTIGKMTKSTNSKSASANQSKSSPAGASAHIKKYKKNSKTRYTVKELQHFKDVLMDEKQKIIDSARANMMSLVDSESGDYVGDDLSYASHMAEQGTDEMEREKNYMFVQRDEKYLGYIEEALTRIDQGTYGVCIDCIDEPKNFCASCPLIPRERLEIVPITQHCIECKNIRG